MTNNDYHIDSSYRFTTLLLILFLFLLPNFSKAQSHRIVVISDLNNAYGALDYEPEVDSTIVRIVRDWKPDLVLCGGDMIAGQRPALTDGRVDSMWMAFDKHIAAPLRNAGIPFGFTLGNHDGSGYPNHTRDRTFARTYFQAPANDTGLDLNDKGDFPFWYSFTSGPFFIASWDATTETITDENLIWLEQQLESETAKSAQFRLVVGHLPLYGVAIGRDTRGNILANADSLRHILEQRNVDLYISGHHHAWYPGRHTWLNLLNAGAIGSGPRSLLDGSTPRKTVTIIDYDGESQSFTETTYDATTWEIIDPSSLPATLETLNGVIKRR